MASKKSYSRYFIILQEDEKGYILDKGKSSSGYVKLEKKNDKCKVSYYAQNINPDMGPYYMVLICKDSNNEKMIVLKKVQVDSQGKVDINCEYDHGNIADSKMSMQHIMGATLGKIVDNIVIPLLTGFLNTETLKDWKKYKIVNNEEEKNKSKNVSESKKEDLEKKDNKHIHEEEHKEEHKKEKEEQEDIKEVELEVEYNNDVVELDNDDNPEKYNTNSKTRTNEKDNIDKTEETEELKDAVKLDKEEKCVEANPVEEIEEDNIFEKYENDVENVVKNKEGDDYRNTRDNDVEFCSIQEQMLREHNEDEEKSPKIKDIPIGTMGAYFKNLVYECEEVTDMGDEIPDCRWYKIPINSMEDLYDSSKFNRYTILYYPMICYHTFISPYKHFCVGYQCDKDGNLRYVIYAIPGIRDKEHQPYGGKTGFVTWIPTNKNVGYGYWLMFYDVKKCTTVVPVKK